MVFKSYHCLWIQFHLWVFVLSCFMIMILDLFFLGLNCVNCDPSCTNVPDVWVWFFLLISFSLMSLSRKTNIRKAQIWKHSCKGNQRETASHTFQTIYGDKRGSNLNFHWCRVWCSRFPGRLSAARLTHMHNDLMRSHDDAGLMRSAATGSCDAHLLWHLHLKHNRCWYRGISLNVQHWTHFRQYSNCRKYIYSHKHFRHLRLQLIIAFNDYLLIIFIIDELFMKNVKKCLQIGYFV